MPDFANRGINVFETKPETQKGLRTLAHAWPPATMYLRDIAVYAEETIAERFPSGFVGWFHRESCCITDLYCSVLGRRVATPDTAKVNLRFAEQEGFTPTVRQLISVADATWGFGFSKYVDRDVDGKKQMILDALQAALLWIANKRQWSGSGFEECHADVIRRNLNFKGWSKKSWVSPNPKYRAKVGFFFGLRSVEFFVGVFDRKGREKGRKSLGSVAPEMGIAHLILKGTGRWIEVNIFRLEIPEVHFHLPKSWQVDLADLVA